MEEFDSRITFVLQGPILQIAGENVTKRSAESIREFFPNATLILSTWSDQDTAGITRDKEVISLQPLNWKLTGASSDTRTNNVNRQILSSRAGLLKVETEFAVKVRSDLVFTANRLSSILNRLDCADSGLYGVFSKRIIVLDRISIDPRKVLPLSFSPCDYLSAGLTEDVLKLWSGDMMSDDEAVYFDGRRVPVEPPSPYLPEGLLARFTAEGHIWRDLFKDSEIELPEDYTDTRPEVIQSSIKTFVANLIPLGQSHIGLDSPKHPRGFDFARVSYCYTYLDWKRDLRDEGMTTQFSTFHSDLIFLWLWQKLTKIWKGMARIWPFRKIGADTPA